MAAEADPAHLLKTIDALHGLLAPGGVRYAFIGALPVMAWGRVRGTSDLDLVVACAPPHWPELRSGFERGGFTLRSQVGPTDGDDPRPDIAMFWLSSPELRVDVFVAKTAFEEAVLDTAVEVAVLGRSLRVASPEAAIVYKLLASRSKDLGDLEALFEARRESNTALDWDFIERWAEDWGIDDRLAPYRTRYKS